MTDVKVVVIYYSSTGSNHLMAQTAQAAAREEGAMVRFRRVQELATAASIDSNPAWKAHHEATRDVPVVTLEDLEWADAIIFSVPTRYGNIPSQLQQFIDTTGRLWFEGKLMNKVVTAMTTAGNDHGGQEETILSLYKIMYHWGAIVVAPGYTDPVVFRAGGNPYGTSTTISHSNRTVSQEVLASVKHQVRRLIQVARWIKRGHTEEP